MTVDPRISQMTQRPTKAVSRSMARDNFSNACMLSPEEQKGTRVAAADRSGRGPAHFRCSENCPLNYKSNADESLIEPDPCYPYASTMATASHSPRDDDASVRRAGPDRLSLALMDSRNPTLALLARWREAQAAANAQVPCEPGYELPQWIAGHVAWFAEWWIGRNPRRGLGRACPADA